MNAKETLKKIAEALNIIDEQPAVEENVDQPVVETQIEEQPVEETKQEEPVADQPVAEEPVVEAQPEANEEPAAENNEVELLKKQLDDMKEILKNALTQPDEPVMPEAPKKEPEGLTHSPEASVRQKAKGIGKKGDDIMSRVFKYMNNN
jgi:hypothetical protein